MKDVLAVDMGRPLFSEARCSLLEFAPDLGPLLVSAPQLELASFAPPPDAGNCCVARNEPGCAVIAAVESGDIYYERYDSFLRLREEIEDLYI